jgi:hypothetical protein
MLNHTEKGDALHEVIQLGDALEDRAVMPCCVLGQLPDEVERALERMCERDERRTGRRVCDTVALEFSATWLVIVHIRRRH